MSGHEKSDSILLIGESSVGKTHFGAQLLKRLMRGDGEMKMPDTAAATNLAPFEDAMNRIDEGMTADHTPSGTYLESIWPITDSSGRIAELVWPDYGGEQIKNMISNRKVPGPWRDRIVTTPAWALLVRLNQTRMTDDIFSRPLADLRGASRDNASIRISDQARLIELLQMLLHVRRSGDNGRLTMPRLAILLSCWDEMGVDAKPIDLFQERLPMVADFVTSNWAQPIVLGLSALGRALKSNTPDAEYVARGPEQFGFIVGETGSHTNDLTLPIKLLLAEAA